MKKLFIFDFDGTLVDTIKDVGICFNEALRRSGLPQHPLERFGSFAGGNLETVVSKMLPPDQVTQENITRVKTVYRELYMNSDKPNTKPYPGIVELLSNLKSAGAAVAVNSNKGQVLLDDMVEKMFPAGFFDAVIGYQEDRPSKPDPYGVELICNICRRKPSEAVYIGDGRSDLDMAENAGIPCVFVLWGQGSCADQNDPRAAARAKNVEQLRKRLFSEEL